MYLYEVLFDTYYEEVPLLRKISFLLARVKDFRPDIVVLPGYSDIALWFVLFYVKVHNVEWRPSSKQMNLTESEHFSRNT